MNEATSTAPRSNVGATAASELAASQTTGETTSAPPAGAGEQPAASPTSSSAASLASDAAANEMLFGFWYPAIEGRELRRGQVKAATLLEQPLAVGRGAEGKPFALADFCPHRAMPLSFGRVVACAGSSAVECCYHGWQFDAHSGQCRAIPSLAPGANVKVERIGARAFPCAERDGTVWVYLPDPAVRESEPPAPPAMELPSARYRSMRVSVEFPSDLDQGVLGLLDPAHGPYVHQSWYWRSSHKQRDKEKTFEPIPNGFRMVPHAPSANSAAYKILGIYGKPVTTAIDFELPGRRTETIRCGEWFFVNRTVVTPIRRDLCRLDFWAAWNLFYWVPLVTPIFRSFARRFIAQDQRNMERQSVGLRQDARHRPPMILVGDADRQARWYFQLKEALARSRRTSEPMAHPLNGPVTLRWRT